MIVAKGVSVVRMIQWSWHHLTWLTLASLTLGLLYNYEIINFNIPWLPISVIGTAVAFFVGFKNNQAYDRMWEARKIWGGIVNNSRTWGMQVDGYVTNLHAKDTNEDELKSIKKRLIYRHIAWLYQHRTQLLIPTDWEHVNQESPVGRFSRRIAEKRGTGLVKKEMSDIDLKDLLPADEFDRLINAKNTATQIINEQSRDLTKLREVSIIEDFRHINLMETLRQFYELQGKNERIKKFPLPRQYANMSRYFVGIFLLLFPFSLFPEFIKLGEFGIWLSIPLAVIIGWVYVMMEVVGDYTENPFQGLPNDIPMLSLCRTIEIDLREMLGETDLPKGIEAKDHILM